MAMVTNRRDFLKQAGWTMLGGGLMAAVVQAPARGAQASSGGRTHLYGYVVDTHKCIGCGKCVENCSLELWVLVDRVDSKIKLAQVTEEAALICHTCGMCSDGCPEKAIVIINGK